MLNMLMAGREGKMEARARNSLTKCEFQITNEKDGMEMGFLDRKRDFRFTIHQYFLGGFLGWQNNNCIAREKIL